jgi:hypothetical protein
LSWFHLCCLIIFRSSAQGNAVVGFGERYQNAAIRRTDRDDRATASAVAGGTVLPPARLIIAQHGRNEKLAKREKNPGRR